MALVKKWLLSWNSADQLAEGQLTLAATDLA